MKNFFFFLKNRKFILISLTVIALSLTLSSYAQYQVYYWADFEKGIPPEAVLLGGKQNKRISVVDLNSIKGMPVEFRSGIAGKETGNKGLLLQAVPEQTGVASNPVDYLTGIAFRVVLDRDKLGKTGRALYQADFFILPSGKKFPSIAVLAMEPIPPGDPTPKNFYRFGITRDRFLYFSHVQIASTQAALFKNDETVLKNIPRPGWHRFAIVFEGAENIRCYIDGQEMPYSPVKESTMRKLQVGIMLADQDEANLCLIDNASIQWTAQDVPLPDSPYATSWKNYVPPPSSSVVQSSTSSNMPQFGATPQQQTASSGQLAWYDPDLGWQKATQTKTNMLIYFQAPRVPATLKLNSIIDTSSAAKNYLSKYTLVKIDVNQLQGGRYAEKFNIFKIPTFVIIDNSGKEVARSTFKTTDAWETFISTLGTN